MTTISHAAVAMAKAYPPRAPMPRARIMLGSRGSVPSGGAAPERETASPPPRAREKYTRAAPASQMVQGRAESGRVRARASDPGRITSRFHRIARETGTRPSVTHNPARDAGRCGGAIASGGGATPGSEDVGNSSGAWAAGDVRS